MGLRSWRWPRRIVAIIAALMFTAAASIPFVLPAVAAYACPSCYGFERQSDGLYVERAMPDGDRAKLQSLVDRATGQVAAFYGEFARPPVLLVCVTDGCYRRIGGGGSRAATYGAVF